MTYAGLLVAIGLVMAYTNSVEDGSRPLEAEHDFSRGPDVGRHRRRRLHRRDGLRLPLAEDPRLADLRPPARAPGPHPGHRRRGRRLGALGRRRAAHLPVQRDRQDPDDHRAGQLPGRARRASSIRSRRSSAPACSSGRRSCWSCSSRTSGPRSSSARSWPGCSGCRAPACAGSRRSRSRSIAMVPIAWTYLLRDYQKAAADRVPRRQPGHPGRRVPAPPGADRGRARAASSARA